MDFNPSVKKEIKEIFSSYLEQHKFRKTSERYTILDEIYSRNDHFDAESLYIALKNKNLGVSRATVYNTLDLLVSCNLVTKHLFNNNQAVYEKAHKFKQHDHIVCVKCKRVQEFCDPRIQQIQSKVGELLNYKITHHSLVLYGVCEDCKLKEINETN